MSRRGSPARFGSFNPPSFTRGKPSPRKSFSSSSSQDEVSLTTQEDTAAASEDESSCDHIGGDSPPSPPPPSVKPSSSGNKVVVDISPPSSSHEEENSQSEQSDSNEDFRGNVNEEDVSSHAKKRAHTSPEKSGKTKFSSPPNPPKKKEERSVSEKSDPPRGKAPVKKKKTHSKERETKKTHPKKNPPSPKNIEEENKGTSQSPQEVPSHFEAEDSPPDIPRLKSVVKGLYELSAQILEAAIPVLKLFACSDANDVEVLSLVSGTYLETLSLPEIYEQIQTYGLELIKDAECIIDTSSEFVKKIEERSSSELSRRRTSRSEELGEAPTILQEVWYGDAYDVDGFEALSLLEESLNHSYGIMSGGPHSLIDGVCKK